MNVLFFNPVKTKLKKRSNMFQKRKKTFIGHSRDFPCEMTDDHTNFI